MYLRLVYNAEPTVARSAQDLALKWNGYFPEHQPESRHIENYISKEVIFQNISDLNKFVYNAYHKFGYYFLIEMITYTSL